MDKATKQLISGYLEKAEKKMAVAHKLIAAGEHEDAVSRAYYAVYHAVQGLLLSEGQKAETHRGAITLFGMLFVKTGKFPKNIGKYLANLKDDREAVDYEVFSFIDQESAESAVREAEIFLKETSKYLKAERLLD